VAAPGDADAGRKESERIADGQGARWLAVHGCTRPAGVRSPHLALPRKCLQRRQGKGACVLNKKKRVRTALDVYLSYITGRTGTPWARSRKTSPSAGTTSAPAPMSSSPRLISFFFGSSRGIMKRPSPCPTRRTPRCSCTRRTPTSTSAPSCPDSRPSSSTRLRGCCSSRR
jgi:hypothetical protein